jgi:hypothetical protein
VSGWFAGTRAELDAAGVPAPALVLDALLAMVALGLAAHLMALWQLGSARRVPAASQRALFRATDGPGSPIPPEEAAALSG